MRIAKLQLQHFRCIQRAEITPGPGLNWLSGSNGAGKTTLLESVYLLSHGHSFRRGAIETLIQRGQSAFLLHAEILRGAERQVLGMSRTAAGWHLRLNGRDLQQLAPFLEGCAAICFEPGGHSLVSGASEGRRRFLDWGVFHVEPRFLEYWRRYRRALRQRNALLRVRNHEEQFAIW
ncbi:MAG: AAA family ATPase, partial [Proteobacteria bacterium]|nr:AAA family ATPase [Pseudomonadota bacterium]